MTAPRDELDRLIDEALAEMAGGEPARVDASTVRQALGGRSRALPGWLAVAAVLLLGLAFAMWPRPEAPLAPTASRSPGSPGDREGSPAEPSSVPGTTPSASASAMNAVPSNSRASANQDGRGSDIAPGPVEAPTEAPYEGLPALAIASLRPLEPIEPAVLAPDGMAPDGLAEEPLRLPDLDIPPISFSRLTEDPHDNE